MGTGCRDLSSYFSLIINYPKMGFAARIYEHKQATSNKQQAHVKQAQGGKDIPWKMPCDRSMRCGPKLGLSFRERYCSDFFSSGPLYKLSVHHETVQDDRNSRTHVVSKPFQSLYNTTRQYLGKP